MPNALNSAALKAKQRQLRDGFSSNVSLRIHRAISWLQGAEAARERKDLDAAFICCWIAFNAAYVQPSELHKDHPEREFFEWYFKEICAVDTRHVVYDAIWQRFSQSIRTLIDNRYVFAPYWRHQHGEPGFGNWASRFESERKMIHSALGRGDTVRVLTVLFDRLYVLRNQLVHGGATWRGEVNRAQVRDGDAIMAFLVPHFTDLMMDNPNQLWGVPPYPVQDAASDQRRDAG